MENPNQSESVAADPDIQVLEPGEEVTPDGLVLFVPTKKTPAEVLQAPPEMIKPPIPAKGNEHYLHAVAMEGAGGGYWPAIYVPPHKVKLGDPNDRWKHIKLQEGQVVSFDQKALDVPKVIGVTLLDGYWLIDKQTMAYVDARAACLTRVGRVEKVGFWCPYFDGVKNTPHHEQHGSYSGFQVVDDPKNPGKLTQVAEVPDRYQAEIRGLHAQPGACPKCAGNPEKSVKSERQIRKILDINKYAQRQG